jgi:putative endonuclease
MVTGGRLFRAILAAMTTARQAFGVLGERIAERWLRRRGWRVVQRRFRSGHRDIDLVVEQDGIVAFVEVKARRGAEFGGPVQAVNWRKRKELERSATVWIDRHGREAETYRFDVVGVLLNGADVRVCHVENAFAIRSPA